MHLRSTIQTSCIALVIAVAVVCGVAAAHGSTVVIDGRSPDTLDAASNAQLRVIDGRSPDTRDAAAQQASCSLASEACRFARLSAGFYSPAATKAMEARHNAMARLGEENQLSPAERVAIQEDARRYDPRIYTPGTPVPERPTGTVVEIVTSGGFHWGDAGVGVGSAFALVLLALGAVILVRNNHLTKA